MDVLPAFQLGLHWKGMLYLEKIPAGFDPQKLGMEGWILPLEIISNQLDLFVYCCNSEVFINQIKS